MLPPWNKNDISKLVCNSIYGEYLYDQVISQDHFLRKLRQIIEWDLFTRKLIKLYKGGGIVGRPPFDPALVLKVELIAYLYNLSERQVEVYINENLPSSILLAWQWMKAPRIFLP